MKRHAAGVFVGGVVLGAVSLALGTWAMLFTADGAPANGSLRSTDSTLWQFVLNEAFGVEWIAIADYGHDLVEPGGGLEPVPEWGAFNGERPLEGTMRVGTLRAGWPMKWCGARWMTHRRSVRFPPIPFDEDLGYGLDDAIKHLFKRKGNPEWLIEPRGVGVDLAVWSSPWWIVLGLFSRASRKQRHDELHKQKEADG